jgi:ABC-2 type transport system ATP-binding protein
VQLTLALEVLVVIAAPLVLARVLRRRWPSVGWATFGLGALTLIGSQVLHLPFNAYVLPFAIEPLAQWPDGVRVPVVSALLGLSAGVFEEVARYGVLRASSRARRSGADALMLGAGHGGLESIAVGVIAALTLVNVLVLQRMDLDGLGLDAEQRRLAQQGLEAVDAMPFWMPLLAIVERLCTLAFHLSASVMVAVAVTRRNPLLLGAAIAWHATYDGVMLVVLHHHGVAAAELWLALTVPVSVLFTWLSIRALPRLARELDVPRPPSTGAPIELVAAEKQFDTVQALGGVSFVIEPGTRACLLGPNGAGKTTAIRLITGALRPTRGHALLFGRTSDDPDFADAKRKVGIVPQQPGMYPELTVRAYLDFVRSLYGAPDDPVLIERLGLAALVDRRTSELSGGMQRRLSLAAALLGRPELLILDEPSAGLDPVAAREMRELLAEVAQGRTTLLCTHDLDEAEELCDTVIILHGGRVLVHEPIARLKARAEARLVLRASDGIEGLAEALASRGGRVLADRVELPWTGGEASVPALLRELLGAGIEVCECRVVQPTLEELFLQLVREAKSAGTLGEEAA